MDVFFRLCAGIYGSIVLQLNFSVFNAGYDCQRLKMDAPGTQLLPACNTVQTCQDQVE